MAGKPGKPSIKLSKSEKISLSAFCDSIKLDEVSLESWDSSHSHLDLSIPIWLPANAAALGGDHTLHYTRTVLSAPGATPAKQKSSYQVSIPTGVKDGTKLLVKGLGDTCADVTGNLIVIVHVKS